VIPLARRDERSNVDAAIKASRTHYIQVDIFVEVRKSTLLFVWYSRFS
jgi:hypothetical protein